MHFFFTKDCKKLYQINNLEVRKKLESPSNTVCAYIAYFIIQKAIVNSSQDIKQNVTRDGGDGDRTKTIPPTIFF